MILYERKHTAVGGKKPDCALMLTCCKTSLSIHPNREEGAESLTVRGELRPSVAVLLICSDALPGGTYLLRAQLCIHISGLGC